MLRKLRMLELPQAEEQSGSVGTPHHTMSAEKQPLGRPIVVGT